MTTQEYIVHAMEESQGNASLWFRYLNKMLTSNHAEEYEQELLKILENVARVNPFYKTTIKVVLSDESWFDFVKGLSQKADSEWIRRKYGL